MMTTHGKPLFNKILLISTFVMFIGLSNSAQAQWYIGVDATNLSYELEYDQGTEEYNLNPIRLKVGYLYNTFALELQVLGSGDDTATDPFGTNFKTEMGTSLGLFGKWVAKFSGGLGGYLSLGLAALDTTYSLAAVPNASDQDDVIALGLGIGGQYEIVKNLNITLDYTLYAGQASYPTFFVDDVDASLSGFGLGLSYAF